MTLQREAELRLLTSLSPVHPDVNPRLHRQSNRKIADDNVDVSVAVDIAEIERRVAWEAHLDGVPRAYARRGLLEPDKGRQCVLVQIRAACEQCRGDDVEVTVGGLRTVMP